ncbi:MAG: ABC-three component system protein [bacterium]
MTQSNSTSTAPGQLLGYILQFPRALCRLLQAGVGGAVGIELIGDVTAFLANGAVINEEDKSSTTTNPLTDRSTDLWKTFYNWIKQIDDGAIDVTKTSFVLYTNCSGRPALVNKFNAAKTPADVHAAIQAAITELKDTSHSHDIWVYYDFVINKKLNTFEKLLLNFELLVGVDGAHDDVRRELKSKFIPDHSIQLVSDNICGWFQEIVSNKLKAKIPAVITFEELDHQIAVLLERLRQKELVDFAATELALENKIAPALRQRPVFIKQLDLIKLSDEMKIQAVCDYLRADYNRHRWIESEILDETTAKDFEKRLYSFWQTEHRKTELLHLNLAEETRGELLLGECSSRQELIRGEPTPDRTVAGTYHALAELMQLGWHPKWSSLLQEKL